LDEYLYFKEICDIENYEDLDIVLPPENKSMFMLHHAVDNYEYIKQLEQNKRSSFDEELSDCFIECDTCVVCKNTQTTHFYYSTSYGLNNPVCSTCVECYDCDDDEDNDSSYSADTSEADTSEADTSEADTSEADTSEATDLYYVEESNPIDDPNDEKYKLTSEIMDAYGMGWRHGFNTALEDNNLEDNNKSYCVIL
jgi:hypothetical protein